MNLTCDDYNQLFQMAEALVSEINGYKGFTLFWGSKSYSAQDLRINLEADDSNFNKEDAISIANLIMTSIKTNKIYINLNESFVKSEFALCDDKQDFPNSEGKYEYKLEEVLPL